MQKNEMDTPFARMKVQDDILEVTYKKGLIITQEVAQQIIHQRLSYCEGIAYPCLILDEGILEIQKAARDLLSSEEGTQQLKASALVLNTAYGRIVGNFFVKLTKPAIPVKVFNNKQHALEWLHQFLAGSI